MSELVGKYFRAAAIICWVGCSGVASAATGSVTSNVVRTYLCRSERYGGCMVQIVGTASGVDCGDWATASCSRDFNLSSMGWKKFEVAQIAQVTERRVRVYVDDARKHNGHCFLQRIDLLD